MSPKLTLSDQALQRYLLLKGQNFGCNVTNPPFIGSQVKKRDLLQTDETPHHYWSNNDYNDNNDDKFEDKLIHS